MQNYVKLIVSLKKKFGKINNWAQNRLKSPKELASPKKNYQTRPMQNHVKLRVSLQIKFCKKKQLGQKSSEIAKRMGIS